MDILKFLALIGAEVSLKEAAKDPLIWSLFQKQWSDARGASWLFMLAMWAGVSPYKIAEALCACIRIGMEKETDREKLEPALRQLEAWAGGQKISPEHIREEAERLSKTWTDQIPPHARGRAWNKVFWSWTVEATADYAQEATPQTSGGIYWGVLKSLVTALEDQGPASDSHSTYARCASAVRSCLKTAPLIKDLPASAPVLSRRDDSDYVEVGFAKEKDWMDAERCWSALKPARLLYLDSEEGSAFWDILISSLPTDRKASQDILTSLNQCEIATGPAQRLSDKTGRLYFEPLAFPFGGTAPIEWFAEAFHLRVSK